MSRKRHGRKSRVVPRYSSEGPAKVATGLPTERDISVFDSLHERWAVKNFLGKEREQAGRDHP